MSCAPVANGKKATKSSACAKPNLPCDVRLQRFLASCGLGSRRACERLIAQGLVQVDGQVVDTPGTTVDPVTQTVVVRGRVVKPDQSYYVLLNKPTGCLCTSSDPQGRRTFHAMLPAHWPRLFSVGRLDYDSEGMLILTNDGEWAHLLMHPRHHVLKKYHVWVHRRLTHQEIGKLRDGVYCDGDCLRALNIRLVRPLKKEGFLYEILLGEGKNRHIRRMLGAIKAEVTRLRRTAVGPVRLGRLPSGSHRMIKPSEVEALRKAATSSKD